MKHAKGPLSSVRELRMSFSLAAVVYLLLGLLMIIAPNTSRRLLCTLVGVGITVYGLLSILPCVLSRGDRRFTLDLFIGACALALGAFSLVKPTFLMDFLFTVLGIVICVTGACGVSRALNLRYYGFARWWAPLCVNLAAIVVALLVIFFPGFFGDMLMMALGILLVIEAVSDLTSIYFLGRLSKRASVSYNIDD